MQNCRNYLIINVVKKEAIKVTSKPDEEADEDSDDDLDELK